MKRKSSKRKMSNWLIVLMIVFYPIGLVYLAVILCQKLLSQVQPPNPPYIPPTQVRTSTSARTPTQTRTPTPAPTQTRTPTPTPLPTPAPAPTPAPTSSAPRYGTREWEEAMAEAKKKREEFQRKKRAEFAAELAAIPRAEITVSATKAKRNLVSDMPEFTYKNITKATPIDRIFPLVVVDTETTGLNVSGGDIIEVSAIKYDKGFVPISCFTTLLKPRKPIPPEATKINGITDDMVSDCPSFAEIAASFSAYIDKCTVVGHNLPFDVKFLHCCGATLPFKSRFYDTLQIARSCLKKGDDVYDYKLGTLCEYYRIYRDNAHRSLSDCLATAKVFAELIDERLSR